MPPSSSPSSRFFLLLAVYEIAGLVVLATAYRLAPAVAVVPAVTSVAGTQVASAVVTALVIAGLFFLVLRRLSVRLFWAPMFDLALFFGCWSLGLNFFPWWGALGIAIVTIALPRYAPRVSWHNLKVVLGTAGTAVYFSLALAPAGLIAFLGAMSIYDLFAVRRQGPLTVLLKDLLHEQVIPGLIIPPSFKGFGARLEEVLRLPGTVLGYGDLVLPLALVSRVAFVDPLRALAVLLGAMAGLAFLGLRARGRPQPALPALTLGAGLPFCVFWLQGYVL